MRCPKTPVFLVLLLPSLILSQRTHARQGLGKEPAVLQIPDQGSIVGKEVLLSSSQRVVQYLGIPYAQAPTGKLRFSPPVTDPLPKWNGVRNATQFGPSCQQISNRLKLHEKLYKRLLPPDQPDPGVSEDCLFLNIFVPDGNRPDGGWPVMVWFHGGDFNTGTPAIWDASVFVSKQKVLVVTVAYRLNIFGFFTTTDGEAPGNYGMFDQIAALDWVQKKIELFNGAPSNVAIYGHSSGAISVGLHMVSPLSKGKFAKAIAMSGDAVSSVGSPQTELPVVDIIAEKFGCYRRPTTALMECLRRVDVNILMKQSSEIETWGPIVDYETNNYTEPFLPMHPREALEEGSFNAVPLLAGYTSKENALAYMEANGKGSDGRLSVDKFTSMISDEFSSAIGVFDENSTCVIKPQMVTDAVLFFYKPHPPTKDPGVLRDRYIDLQTDRNFAAGLTLLAGKNSMQKSSSYVYRFDYRPRTPALTKDVPEWVGVPHMFELPFVWGLPLAPGSNIVWNFADKKLSEIIMMMLASFVKTGNPSLSNIKWEAYTEEDPGILLIDRNIDMNEGNSVDYRAFAFWNEYYPRVVEEATNTCCNITSLATTITDISYSFQLVCLAASIAIPCLRL